MMCEYGWPCFGCLAVTVGDGMTGVCPKCGTQSASVARFFQNATPQQRHDEMERYRAYAAYVAWERSG